MARPDGVYWIREYMRRCEPAPRCSFFFTGTPGSGSVNIRFYVTQTDQGPIPVSDPPNDSANVTLQLTEGQFTALVASGGIFEEWLVIDALNVCNGGSVLYIRVELDTGGADDADYSGGLVRRWCN